MQHEAIPDSATTQFSFLMDSSKRSVNCPGFARSPMDFNALSLAAKAREAEEQEQEEPALFG